MTDRQMALDALNMITAHSSTLAATPAEAPDTAVLRFVTNTVDTDPTTAPSPIVVAAAAGTGTTWTLNRKGKYYCAASLALTADAATVTVGACWTKNAVAPVTAKPTALLPAGNFAFSGDITAPAAALVTPTLFVAGVTCVSEAEAEAGAVIRLLAVDAAAPIAAAALNLALCSARVTYLGDNEGQSTF